MKIAFKFLITLALALLMAWALRSYAFTVFSVPPGGLGPQLEGGGRVIVNRLDCDFLCRGELIVFADSTLEQYFIGQVERLPGDTVRVGRYNYRIPLVCCTRCGCKDCRYYLVRTSPRNRQLVHKHQVLGKAYKLF